MPVQIAFHPQEWANIRVSLDSLVQFLFAGGPKNVVPFSGRCPQVSGLRFRLSNTA